MPTVFEVNVTVTEHDAPDAMLVPQVFVWLNGPVIAMLVTERADAPVFVNTTLWVGGGHGFTLEFNLQEKLRLAGRICAVPFVNVIVAVLNFVASVIETALTLTAVFAGKAAGPLKADAPGLAVLAGFIVPHPGEQSLPF